MESHELIARLSALRRIVRRRLVAYGVFAVFGGGAIALLTVITLDWFLWLPPALRIFGGILFVLGFFAATYYWIMQPLRARLSYNDIAAQLERHFDPLRDRLVSSVNFLERAGNAGHKRAISIDEAAPGRATPVDGASEELVREVIAGTERKMRDVQLESALSVGPVAARGSIFGVSMVVLIALFILAPQWLRTGIQRYASPLGSVEWPRRVQIVPATGDLIVPLGESATVSMRVERGLRDSLRGVVHLRSPGGNKQLVALKRDAEGEFFATLDAVTEDLQYWFEAGDDTTRNRPATIRVVQRPEVVEAIATVSPPSYARNARVRVADLAVGPLAATIGSRVAVGVRASKPVLAAESSLASGNIAEPETKVVTSKEVGLRFEDESFVPLVPSTEDPQMLFAEFPLSGDVAFRIDLRDEHGFRNHSSATYRFSALPDVPPSVRIERPVAAIDATPKSTIQLEATITDDFGVQSAELHAYWGTNAETLSLSLSENIRPSATPDGVSATLRHEWPLYELRLTPGVVVQYEVIVEDNYHNPSVQYDSFADSPASEMGQISRSSPQQIRIISEAEFELRVREEVVALEARIRQAVLEQDELRGRTDALTRLMDRASAMTENETSVAVSLALGEARLGRRIREISAGFDGLADRVQQNLPGDDEPIRRMTELAESLRDTAAGSVAEAESHLAATRQLSDPAAQHESMDNAVAAQETAMKELRTLLRTVSEWGTFQNVVSRTRDLLDRQTSLMHDTVRIGQSTLGKSAESLTTGEAEEIARTQRRQDQLTQDVEQHLARMGELADSARSRQPAAADAMDSAIRTARANQLDRRMRSASEAIGENRTAAATAEQRAAADAMRKMVSALREREKRELEELRKQLNKAEDQVAWLIEHQQTLLTATGEAALVKAEPRTFRQLENQQRTLARNATATAAELGEVDRAIVAAKLVQQAVAPMEQAGYRLSDILADAALKSQQDAIDVLHQALNELKRLEQDAAEQALRQSLEDIQDGIHEILEAQLAINDGVGKLDAAVGRRGELGRAETRHAAKLARDQADAREMIGELLVELQKVPVYEWALQRAGRWMEDSRDALNLRRIDAELLATTDRIASELEKLIGALRETLNRPLDTEFAEAEGAGGGESGGEAASSASVPTMAELLVLRAIQVDINERTRKFAEEIDPNTAGEADLRQLVTIAEDQAEVRRLTVLVTERATQNQ